MFNVSKLHVGQKIFVTVCLKLPNCRLETNLALSRYLCIGRKDLTEGQELLWLVVVSN
jgi:hypothetical protein